MFIRRFLCLALISTAPALSAGVARAQEVAKAPVAARDLPRGTVLTPDDLEYREISSSGAGSVRFAELGWVTRSVIRKGDALRYPLVQPVALVSVGDSVDVLIHQGLVTLRVRGQARGSAGAGESLRVRLGTGRIVEGVVDGPGTVEIQSPRRAS